VRAFVTYAATLLSLVRSAPPLPALTAAGRVNAPNAPNAARLVWLVPAGTDRKLLFLPSTVLL